MTIGQGPGGIPVNTSAGNPNTNDKSEKASKKTEEDKTSTEAYTLDIGKSPVQTSNVITAETTLKNETEALDSAAQVRKTLMQNPDNSARLLSFNMTRIAGLMQGLAETSTA